MIPDNKQPSRVHRPLRLIALVYLLASFVVSAFLPRPAQVHAAGSVSDCSKFGPGPGTLQEALAGGGTITFTCSATITVSSTITMAADTVLDATDQSVTISGGNT